MEGRNAESFSEGKTRGRKLHGEVGILLYSAILVSSVKSKRRKNISKLQREVTLLSPRCNCARISQNENFLSPLLSQFPRSRLFSIPSHFPFPSVIHRSRKDTNHLFSLVFAYHRIERLKSSLRCCYHCE